MIRPIHLLTVFTVDVYAFIGAVILVSILRFYLGLTSICYEMNTFLYHCILEMYTHIHVKINVLVSK